MSDVKDLIKDCLDKKEKERKEFHEKRKIDFVEKTRQEVHERFEENKKGVKGKINNSEVQFIRYFDPVTVVLRDLVTFTEIKLPISDFGRFFKPVSGRKNVYKMVVTPEEEEEILNSVKHFEFLSKHIVEILSSTNRNKTPGLTDYLTLGTLFHEYCLLFPESTPEQFVTEIHLLKNDLIQRIS